MLAILVKKWFRTSAIHIGVAILTIMGFTLKQPFHFCHLALHWTTPRSPNRLDP